jgi:hypothetical protein
MMIFLQFFQTKTHERGPVGDLARNASRDPDAPANGSVLTWWDYDCGSHKSAVAAFDEAWGQYKTRRRTVGMTN